MYNKGIILEIKEKYSLVLKDDSTVVRIRNKENMQVGDTIFFLEEDLYELTKSRNTMKNKIIPILTIAAMLVLLVVPIVKNNTTGGAYALMSIDINPSIEFELDKNKNIVNVYGVNDDGKTINLEELKGKTLEEGINILEKYLSKNHGESKEGIVGFTFTNKISNDKYESEVKDTVSKGLNNTKFVYLKGNEEDIALAKEKGVSIGRYEALCDLDEDTLEDTIENMSVDEIMALLGTKGKDNVYLNEEVMDELQDELEDRTENESDDEDDDDGDGDDDDDDDDDDKDDD